jgi:signal transduction histidine kinase
MDLLHRVGEALELTVDPETAAWVVLVAMTAGEGLGFNRAFFLVAKNGGFEGVFGLGPRSAEEARQVWADLRQWDWRPLDRLASPDAVAIAAEKAKHAGTLAALGHLLGEACGTWRHAFVARASHPNPCVRRWLDVLQSRALLVVPLLVDDTPWGVVLADNFVTNAPIYLGTVEAAETLAHALRAAVERTQLLASLREEQQRRIAAEHGGQLLEAARAIAHELKNPLALAGGVARELAAFLPADGEVLARQLSLISGAIARVEQKVAELADGLASWADGVNLQAVEVGSLTERLVESLRSTAVRRMVRLLCYRPSRPIVAAATAPLFERCLEGLVTQAIEATSGPGAEVHVVVREVTGSVRIEVADNGPPLASELRQGGAHPAYRRRAQGPGMSWSYALAEALGGRIEYDEKDAPWVRFSVVLRRWS